MEEQTYTIAQLVSQVNRALQPLRPLVQLGEMLQSTVDIEGAKQEAEAYLAQLGARIVEQEQKSRELAQDYVDLQARQADDIQEHQKKMHDLRQREHDKELEVMAAIKKAEDEQTQIQLELEEREERHRQECQAAMDEMQEELDAKEAKLAKINTRLAKLGALLADAENEEVDDGSDS